MRMLLIVVADGELKELVSDRDCSVVGLTGLHGTTTISSDKSFTSTKLNTPGQIPAGVYDVFAIGNDQLGKSAFPFPKGSSLFVTSFSGSEGLCQLFLDP